MPFEFPSNLGPFMLDDLGRITPRAGRDTPNFVFQWRGRKIVATLRRGAGEETLLMSTWLGRVPSSAAPQAGDLRAASFAALRTLLGALPKNWRAYLLADHRVRLDASIVLALPSSAVELITAVTRFLLTLAPYLDFLDEDSVLEPFIPMLPPAVFPPAVFPPWAGVGGMVKI